PAGAGGKGDCDLSFAIARIGAGNDLFRRDGGDSPAPHRENARLLNDVVAPAGRSVWAIGNVRICRYEKGRGRAPRKTRAQRRVRIRFGRVGQRRVIAAQIVKGVLSGLGRIVSDCDCISLAGNKIVECCPEWYEFAFRVMGLRRIQVTVKPTLASSRT